MRRLNALCCATVLTLGATVQGAPGKALFRARKRPPVTVSAGLDDGHIVVKKEGDGEGGTPGGVHVKRGRRLIKSDLHKPDRPRQSPLTCVSTGNNLNGSGFLINYVCDNGRLKVPEETNCYGVCDPILRNAEGKIITRKRPAPDLGALWDIASKQIPLPEPMLSPPLERDGVETLVGLPVFFASTNYKPVVLAATDGLWALTVTATPTALILDPADDAAPVSCPGPGIRVSRTSQINAGKRTNCWHLYTETPGTGHDYDATLAITWSISAIIDATGIDDVPVFVNTLPAQFTTTTAIPLTVTQRQAVLAPPSE